MVVRSRLQLWQGSFWVLQKRDRSTPKNSYNGGGRGGWVLAGEQKGTSASGAGLPGIAGRQRQALPHPHWLRLVV